MDKITVIEQTTAERKAELLQLYEDCRPYLDDGLTLRKAVQQVKGTNHHTFTRCAWYRDLLHYARSKGYEGN